jgi:putative ABC transport system permease protein
MTKQFIRWVALATLIAWPVAFFTMRQWLAGFAYRTHIGWDTFLTAAGLAILIALITVSFQAIRAALANPVDSLRYE